MEEIYGRPVITNMILELARQRNAITKGFIEFMAKKHEKTFEQPKTTHQD